MNTPKSKSFINQKREREKNSNDNKETDELEKPEKKFKSAESKKTMDLNLKEIKYFIAMLEPKYENIIFAEDKKFIGKKLNFKYRQNQAQILINKIFEKNIYDNKEIIEALEYDNTNKSCIYALLVFNKNENDKNKFIENLKKYKYCITQKFIIKKSAKKKIVDINELYKIDLPIEELEQLPDYTINKDNTIKDLRNSLVEFFTNYYHIAKNIIKFIPLLKEEEINKIIKVSFFKDSNNNFKLNYHRKEKQNLLKNVSKKKEEAQKKLLESIENFLSKYLYYQDFEEFKMNQPIDYNHNLTLYYNYIIWSLYEITIGVNESEQTIFIKKEKLIAYKKLFKFHDLLFDKYFDKGIPFNNTMNQLLQYLLLALSSNNNFYLDYICDYINLEVKDKFMIDDKSAKIFIKKLKEKCTSLNETFIEDKKSKIEIKWKNYTKETITKKTLNINWLWENINYEIFQKKNFFQEEDINYLKYIIKHILSSKLFKQIFEAFNNITPVADYYFNEPENIDDYIERIIFLPYGVKDLNKYGITDRRLLSILVAGFPENSSIRNFEQYRIYRILELSLREIILADHEPCHFIKSAYSIITEGIISRNTSTDKNIKSGFFLEEVLFGWKHGGKNQLNLIELKLLKNHLECKNSAISDKKIDLITALKLLDPELYNYDLDHFRNIIFNLSKEDLETFSFPSKADETYKKYIESTIGSPENIKKLKNCDLSIHASMGCSCGMSVEYIRFNHNLARFDNSN